MTYTVKTRGFERSALVMRGRETVAEVFTDREAADQHRNAALFAAAPDMAEALHHALRLMLTGHQLAQTDSDAAWMFIHKAEDACRRAIARAEGKA